MAIQFKTQQVYSSEGREILVVGRTDSFIKYTLGIETGFRVCRAKLKSRNDEEFIVIDGSVFSARLPELKTQYEKYALESALGRDDLGKYIMDTYTVHEQWGDSWVFSFSGGNTKFYFRHSLKESSIGVLDPNGDNLLGTRWIASTPEAIADFLKNAVSEER